MLTGEKTYAAVGNIEIETGGRETVELDISGVHVATTVLEFSTDNFATVEVVPMQNSAGAYVASTVSTQGKFRAWLPPIQGKVRARISAYTSGAPKHVLKLR